MRHAYTPPLSREIAKATWGFTSVPFLVVGDSSTGATLLSGPPSRVTVDAIAELITAVPTKLDATSTSTVIPAVLEELDSSCPVFKTDDDF